jgi:hypothetical protein
MSSINKKFRKKFSKEERQAECKRIEEKFPDRIPLVIDIEGGGLHLPRRKYLVERDMLFINFAHVIRQRLKVGPNESLFFFCEGCIPQQTHTLQQIFKERGSEDGFLVLTIMKENTFGV